MSLPIRIQRRRVRGWRMPENTIYVGRGSNWGNPYRVGIDGDAEKCVALYAAYLLPYTHSQGTLDEFYISDANLSAVLLELKGKNLACWCALGLPCHADFLLDIANRYLFTR